MTTKHNLLRESLILSVVVLVALKILYEFRDVSWIGDYLPTYAAILLIYTPIIHLTLRGSHQEALLFFEHRWIDVGRSVGLFCAVSLLIFPTFLVLNHYYQKVFFHYGLEPAPLLPAGTVLLAQLFLVALPEEFFFRGYLQEQMAGRFHKKINLLGLSLSQGAIITCLLFAFAHSLITLQWWHFSIFFPALVFAWMREKSGTITASILFHATSNLLINWMGNSYH